MTTASLEGVNVLFTVARIFRAAVTGFLASLAAFLMAALLAWTIQTDIASPQS